MARAVENLPFNLGTQPRFELARAIIAGALEVHERDDGHWLKTAPVLIPALWPILAANGSKHSGPLTDALSLAHELNTDRNAAILAQLEEVAKLLNAIGIEPMPIKGTCHLLTGLWQTPGSRFLNDIDLLVPEDRLEQAYSVVAEYCGQGDEYSSNSAIVALHKHAAPLRARHWRARLELHHSVFPKRTRDLLPARGLFDRGCRAKIGNATVCLPFFEDQVLIALGHGPLGSGYYLHPTIIMRDLIDLVFLRKKHGDRIVWHRIQSNLRQKDWGVVCAIADRLMTEGLGLAPLFERVSKVESLDASRWFWQERRPWTRNLGRIAEHLYWNAESIAIGGDARERAMRRFVDPAAYRRQYDRYVRGQMV